MLVMRYTQCKSSVDVDPVRMHPPSRIISWHSRSAAVSLTSMRDSGGDHREPRPSERSQGPSRSLHALYGWSVVTSQPPFFWPLSKQPTCKRDLVHPRHDCLGKVDELPVYIHEVAAVLVHDGRANQLQVECPILHVFRKRLD